MGESKGKGKKAPAGSPAHDLWVAGEVAAHLRLSDKSVYRLTKANPPIPHVKIGGGSVRFPRERLFRWLASQTLGSK